MRSGPQNSASTISNVFGMLFRGVKYTLLATWASLLYSVGMAFISWIAAVIYQSLIVEMKLGAAFTQSLPPNMQIHAKALALTQQLLKATLPSLLPYAPTLLAWAPYALAAAPFALLVATGSLTRNPSRLAQIKAFLTPTSIMLGPFITYYLTKLPGKPPITWAKLIADPGLIMTAKVTFGIAIFWTLVDPALQFIVPKIATGINAIEEGIGKVTSAVAKMAWNLIKPPLAYTAKWIHKKSKQGLSSLGHLGLTALAQVQQKRLAISQSVHNFGTHSRVFLQTRVLPQLQNLWHGMVGLANRFYPPAVPAVAPPYGRNVLVAAAPQVDPLANAAANPPLLSAFAQARNAAIPVAAAASSVVDPSQPPRQTP